jgi:hypothetical protein
MWLSKCDIEKATSFFQYSSKEKFRAIDAHTILRKSLEKIKKLREEQSYREICNNILLALVANSGSKFQGSV